MASQLLRLWCVSPPLVCFCCFSSRISDSPTTLSLLSSGHHSAQMLYIAFTVATMADDQSLSTSSVSLITPYQAQACFLIGLLLHQHHSPLLHQHMAGKLGHPLTDCPQHRLYRALMLRHLKLTCSLVSPPHQTR